MLFKRRRAAETVAQRLFEAESAIDIAIAKAAELNAILPVARTDAEISAVVGQEAIESAAKTYASLVKARQRIVATHHELEAVKTRIGLRTFALGGGMEKPAVASTHLTVVDSSAA